MAINVTKFMVTNDLQSMELDITAEPGHTITSIALWDENTYNNPDPEVLLDLTSLLEGTTNTESLVIGQVDLSGTIYMGDLTGIYFMRISASNGDAIIVATINLTQWYIVTARLIANVDLSCLNCNANFQNALLLDLYLEAIKSALTIGRFKDAIQHLSKLKITAGTGDCSECDTLEPLISTAGNIVSVGVIDCTITTP